MKTISKLLLFVFVLCCSVVAQAASIVVTVTFKPGVGNPTTTEHFVEQKQADGSWIETIAKGTNTSVLSYTTTANYGDVITVRVRSRLPGVPASVSDPSNAPERTIKLNPPTDAKQS